jgi:hypothetical protein
VEVTNQETYNTYNNEHKVLYVPSWEATETKVPPWRRGTKPKSKLHQGPRRQVRDSNPQQASSGRNFASPPKPNFDVTHKLAGRRETS